MALRINGDEIFYDCFLCNRPFQFGHGVYNGRNIGEWRVQLCDMCLRSNWDGIVLNAHPQLEKHLSESGIEITLNANGWLDIPPR